MTDITVSPRRPHPCRRSRAPLPYASPSWKRSPRWLSGHVRCANGGSHTRVAAHRVIRRVQDLPAIIDNHDQHSFVPVLQAEEDDLPFAMSLNVCEDVASFDLLRSSMDHPLCELLYFLDGSGSVSMRNAEGKEARMSVNAGDSVLTTGQNVVVHNHPNQESRTCLTFLRVILPVQYVVEMVQRTPQITTEYRNTVAEATQHWGQAAKGVPEVSAIIDGIFTTDRTQMQGLDSGVGRMQDLEGSNPEPSHLRKVSLLDAPAFQLPNQQNRLALVFDPVTHVDLPWTFGVEIFPPHFNTPPHVHDSAHEMFFIISGYGATAFCEGQRNPINPGDVVVFRPGCVHGIDTGPEPVYCLELLLPNEDFAEMVRQGQKLELNEDDSCILAAIGCGSEAATDSESTE